MDKNRHNKSADD